MHDGDRIVTDTGQSVTSTLTTEAFGVVVSQSGASANPYRFAGAWGYRDDGDAGLLHLGARYYDPQVGRFISRDPVLSEHPYLYCEHEPVSRVDPSGHFDIEAAIVGAAIGAATAPPGFELPYAYWGFIGGGWGEGDFARIGKIPNSRTNPGITVPEDLPFWQDVARRVNDWVKRFWDDIKKYQRPIYAVGIQRK